MIHDGPEKPKGAACTPFDTKQAHHAPRHRAAASHGGYGQRM
jgi:hypothetical protein